MSWWVFTEIETLTKRASMTKDIRKDPTHSQREHGNIGLFNPHSLHYFAAAMEH